MKRIKNNFLRQSMGLSFFMNLQESGTKSKKVFDEKLKSPKSL